MVSLLTYSPYFYNDRQYAQNLHKQNTFSLLLFFLYLFLSFFPILLIISTPFLLSFLLLFLFSTHYLFSFILLLCSFSSHLLLYSLLLHSLSCPLLLYCFPTSCNSNNCFCNFNIIMLFSIICFNNLVASSFPTPLINSSIFTWLTSTIFVAMASENSKTISSKSVSL